MGAPPAPAPPRRYPLGDLPHRSIRPRPGGGPTGIAPRKLAPPEAPGRDEGVQMREEAEGRERGSVLGALEAQQMRLKSEGK